jgi:type III secretion system YscD/HrpQ family protein
LTKLLKILSGQHAGAELPLADGEYLVGSGDDCDIILTDPGIEPEHARLKIFEGEFSCAVAGGKVLLEGEEIGGEAQAADFQVVTLGKVHLAAGSETGKWREIVFPENRRKSDASVATSKSEENGKPEDNGKKDRQNSTTDAASTATDKHSTTANSNPATAKSDQSRPVVESQTRMPIAAILVLAGVILAIAAAVILFTSKTDKRNEAVRILAENGVSAVVIDAKSRENAPNDPKIVMVSLDDSGKVKIHGVMADTEQLTKITETLRAKMPDTIIEIRSRADIIAGLQDKISTKYPGIVVESAGSSRIRVCGFVKDDKVASDVEKLAETASEGVAGISCNLLTWKELKPEINRLLQKRRWGYFLPHIDILDDRLAVTGLSASTEKVKWQEVISMLESRMMVPVSWQWVEPHSEPVTIAVVTKIEPAPEPETPTTVATTTKPSNNNDWVEKTDEATEVKPDNEQKGDELTLGVSSVELTPLPKFMDDNGIWHRKGALLANGYQVSDVFAEGIMLKKNGSSVILSIGDRLRISENILKP